MCALSNSRVSFRGGVLSLLNLLLNIYMHRNDRETYCTLCNIIHHKLSAVFVNQLGEILEICNS